ncbi:MAG: hypothetical protein K940chlam6_00507 [Chlamydiae bacterium]|nr:hypothetical protein [Chlamydiota bacterium]
MITHFKEYGFFPAFLLPYDELNVLPYEKKLLEITPEEFNEPILINFLERSNEV